MDVTVQRGATCNTDQLLVCSRLRLQRGGYRRIVLMARSQRFDVKKLGVKHYKESDEGERAVRDEFQEQVVERAREAW